MAATIQFVKARQIFDSRGNPTVEVEVGLSNGVKARAAVPSGASTGVYEALELRDGGSDYLGKGVSKAVNNVNTIIGPALIGKDPTEQSSIDNFMVQQLDGTVNEWGWCKQKLGANAILAVSLAVCKAGANALNIPLYQHIANLAGNKNLVLPVPAFNVINGGSHAGNKLAMQEFMILPVGASSFKEAMKMGVEVYHHLKSVIKKKYGQDATNVGDEGGFAPNIQENREGLELLKTAIAKAGYTKEVVIGMDVAASEFYGPDKLYDLNFKEEGNDGSQKISGDALKELYKTFTAEYPIVSIEDPFDQDDWEHYSKLTAEIGDKVQIVGDDLLVTNPKRVEKAINEKSCNALLLKVNQIGSVTESIEAVKMSKRELCAQIRGLCTSFSRRQISSAIYHHLRLLSHLPAPPVSSPTSAMAVPNQKDQAYLDAVIEKRVDMFKKIQQVQEEQRQAMAGDPIKITMPDGSMKEGKKWQSRPYDIALEIAKSLASNALISQVNGVLWDMYRPLEGDCELKFFNFDTDEGRDTFWHSSAHILGEALEQEYGCKLCIGPCTTRGEGFYYDAFYGDLGLNEDHFKRIESGASKAAGEKQPFERIEVTRAQALEMFSDNNFKVEIIKDLPEDKTITVYRCGPLVDLCRGPHIPNTSFVKAFKCLKASSAYWRGDKNRESLQRVYGISYPDQKRLKEYITRLEEAKKYDHRLLGVKQELFFCHPYSPGSWFFLPHGARVYNKLQDFIRSQYWQRGYEEVKSPNMFNMQLWETSGHAANYKENMFVFEVEKQEFGLKPMNCPGHCLMFDHRVRSYRELPLRLADFGVLHRNEASGALTGLTRVRRFQQDDAHIFCRESQVKAEVMAALDFINHVYTIFGFTYELKLSTRPEKYLGELATWEKAEADLADALNEFGKPWEINEGDGAFYGPKIDISVSDALKRKFQCATLQLDFQLPQRFNLTFSAEDESKREKPVMIHRAVLGSVERMFAILLEHYKGKWPFWISPRQAIVCPVSEKSQAYGLKVRDLLHDAGYYVDADLSDRKIDKKVREAQLAQYNYILVVGEKEAATGQVSVRVRDKAEHSVMNTEDLLTHFKAEIAAYH